MSLFMCRECGCVENTACCNYWSAKMDKTPLLCAQDECIRAVDSIRALKSAAPVATLKSPIINGEAPC